MYTILDIFILKQFLIDLHVISTGSLEKTIEAFGLKAFLIILILIVLNRAISGHNITARLSPMLVFVCSFSRDNVHFIMLIH